MTREFEFTRDQFDWIRAYAKQHAGINLTEAKFDLVYSRLARRIRTLGLGAFAPYLQLLESGDAREARELINALTTNVTAFFRENHHFEALRDVFGDHPPGSTLRIWSCACSTGEEPYSIAMVLLEAGVSNFRILASDLDSTVLKTAAEGSYPISRTKGVDDRRLRRWFVSGRGSRDGEVRVKPELQRNILFRCVNLMDGWRMRSPLDAIFCRNVIIYFDRATQTALFRRFAECIRPGGYLFLGHSESVQGEPRFRLSGRTTYRRDLGATRP